MLLLISSFAALGGFLYGYDLGLIGGALLNIREELNISLGLEEAIVGSAKFGAFFATFLGGALMKQYGRRITIAANSVLFVTGPLIMAFAGGPAALIVGRAVVGMGIGISAVVVPAYLGEVAPAYVRGRIVMLYEVLLAFGMLAAIFADTALQHVANNWRWMVGLPCIPGLLIAAAFFLLPESPRWLVVQGKLDAALAAMHRVYTNNRLPQGQHASTAEVEGELLELWSNVEKERAAAEVRTGQGRLRHRKGVSKPSFAQQRWVDVDEAGGVAADSCVSPPANPRGVAKDFEAASLASSGSSREQARAMSQLARDFAPGGPLIQKEGGDGGLGDADQHVAAEDSGQRPDEDGGEAECAAAALAEEGPRSDDPATWLEEEASERKRLKSIRVEGPGPGNSRESGKASVAGELADPSSPLHRALSRVPSNLAPIRTRLAVEEGQGGSTGSSSQALAGMQAAAVGRTSPRPASIQRLHLAPAGKGGRVCRELRLFGQTFGDMLLDIWLISVGPERRAMRIALALAFFNQAIASSAIVNYAPRLLSSIGVASHMMATLLTAAITVSKMVGVMMSVVLVDSMGRRPLLVRGSLGCCVAMLVVAGGDAWRSAPLVLLGMAAFMLAFSCSHAGVFWVVCSEIFSMSAKSPAVSAATAMLFLIGALTNSLFLTLYEQLGWGSFVVFSAVAAAAAVFCFYQLPETKERTLLEVQALLAAGQPSGDAQRGEGEAGVEAVAPAGAHQQRVTRSSLLHSGEEEPAGVGVAGAGEGIRQPGFLQKLPFWMVFRRR